MSRENRRAVLERVHRERFSDMPFAEFARRIGYQPSAAEEFDAGWRDEPRTASRTPETRPRRDRGPDDWEVGWRLSDQAERGDRG